MQQIHVKTVAIFLVNFFHYQEKDFIIFPDVPDFQEQILRPENH